MGSIRSWRGICIVSGLGVLISGCSTPTQAPEGFFGMVYDKLPDHPIVELVQTLESQLYYTKNTEFAGDYIIDAKLFDSSLTGDNTLSGNIQATIKSSSAGEGMQHEILIQGNIDGQVENDENVSIDLNIELTAVVYSGEQYVMIEGLDIQQSGRKIESLELWQMILETQIGKWLKREKIRGLEYLESRWWIDRINSDMTQARVVPDLNNGWYISNEGDKIMVEDNYTPTIEKIKLTLIPEQVITLLTGSGKGVYQVNAELSKEHASSFDGNRSTKTSGRKIRNNLYGTLTFPQGILATIDTKSETTVTTTRPEILPLPDRWIQGEEIFK